ncbi:MAG: polysaccharide deacetylase family protein [Brooklawnia sp.]|uniref:polysaccharide deacetylase family protein n=1 Tax=Brooklawnia sp. TaxID=2699740 RepID=UPI003C748C3F
MPAAPAPAAPVPAVAEEGEAAIAEKYASVANLLGPATGPVTCNLAGGGCGQQYTNGVILWSPGTGAHWMKGAILVKWREYGSENGRFGYPVTDEVCGLVRDGCYQLFESGAAIVWSASTGAHNSWGGIRAKWREYGSENGRLGYPTSDEVCGLVRDGCYQLFEAGAAIVWSASTGAHNSWGGIRTKWREYGSENGRLGYPTSDEVCGLVRDGCYQMFEAGAIVWSAGTGAHTSWGGIRAKWRECRSENGRLGYPVTDEICGLVRDGCYQLFETGAAIVWSAGSGAHPSWGAIRQKWASTGSENGRYGYPTSDESCRTGAGGELCVQHFEAGTIKWRSDSGIIDCSVQRCVALTFDDGPGPYTSRLLDILDANNVQATFFVVGNRVGGNSSLVARMHREGNLVENHSWSHPDLTTQGSGNIAWQLDDTSNAIANATGARPTMLRPPYGAYNSTVTSMAGQRGMSVILWNVDTQDWLYRNAASVRNAAVVSTSPGSIVLMHDIHPTTVDAVQGIIYDLKGRDYVLVTVDDLLGDPRPGVVYTRR